MALPTMNEAYLFFALYKMVRITTLKSKSPCGVKYPTEPNTNPFWCFHTPQSIPLHEF